MRKSIITVSLLFIAVASYLYYLQTTHYINENSVRVDFDVQTSDTSKIFNGAQDERLYVAVSAMISPKETFISYKDLIQYMAEKYGKAIQFKQRKTYLEVNQLLESGQLDFAFVCSGAYILTRDKNTVDLLVAPVVNNETLYYGYIITNTASGIDSFEDLKGKTFAYTDPLSNTGKFYPVSLIRKLGFSPENFFSKTIYTYAHDNSIQAVNRRIVDGAAVESLIFEYIKSKEPERLKNIRIIHKSEGFGIPPVVVPHNLDAGVRKKLQNIFLNMDKDPSGRAILKELQIDRFALVNDKIYDSVRRIKM